MISRFENIKNLYRQVIASELVSSADDHKSKEEEYLKGLSEGLLTEETKSTKPTATPKGKSEEKFIPLEELGKQLGGATPLKKTPIFPHREKGKTLDLTLPDEMETTKFTPGAIKGKVCDICGKFNFPAWRKECSYCKRTYNFMRDLVDFKGLTPAKAAKAIAGGQTRVPTEEEFAGVITSPERLPVKKKHYLTEDQLKEIWMKGGKIMLPDLPETLDQRFEDKKGLIGVPNIIKMQNALETQLNVQTIDKEVFDPKTGQTFKTKDVYYNTEGEPVPIKYSERDFFSIADIAKKLKLDVTGVLKAITNYNEAQGLKPNDPKAIRPVRYYDELNQIFSWKNSIEPVFKDRIKEVYKMFKNTYLSNLSQRKEKLDEDILKLELSVNMITNNKNKIQENIEKHSDRKALATLFKLRQDTSELFNKINELKGEPTKRNALIDKLNKINETKEPLESKYGKDLNTFIQKMKETTDELMRISKRIKRMKQSRDNIITEARNYIDAVGKPGQIPEELKPADLQKAQTGHSAPVNGDIDLEELGTKLTGKKKAYQLNSFLKIADDSDKIDKLPGQLELPFSEFDPTGRKEKALKTIFRDLTPEELEKRKIRVKIIMKGKLTREEAEDRLDASNDLLTNEENLTPKQKIERQNKIRKLMEEHPTEEEAISRLDAIESSKPLPMKEKQMIEHKKELSGDIYKEQECPFCKKNKIIKDSDRCTSCGFISVPNRKDVVVEKTQFKLVYDKDGNSIPKLDTDGNQMIDIHGNSIFKKRPEKQYSLVSIQFDDLGQPKWAQARKVSATTPDIGTKTKEEKEKFYERMGKENPKIREIKPLTKTPEDFRPIYNWIIDEKTKTEKKVDSGKKEHKQKCKGCPDPWVKVKPEQFSEFPVIEEAYKFIKGDKLNENTKAWLFQNIYQPKEEKIDKQKSFEPTILPIGSSRFEQILKLSKMP